MEVIKTILWVVNLFFVLYLIGYSTFLFISVVIGSVDLYRQKKNRNLNEKIENDYEIPVSIIIPAHNEEVTVVDTINSLLSLEYTNYEIIVVDDGSTDSTAQKIIYEFNMQHTQRPVEYKIKCKSKRDIYETYEYKAPITLVMKQNGGKADSLNMGINIAEKPYFICMDADSLLQYDSLKKISSAVLEDNKIVACGGLIRISNGIEFNNGKIKSHGLPKKLLPAMQVLEYDRSFFASRIMLDRFNGNLIISGAFGLFKKDIVISAGGYETSTVGEDMELVMKLHVFCKMNKIPYTIKYLSDAVCWSQAPESLRDLIKQRKRWHIGLFQSMKKYKELFANYKYGLISFVSFLYFLLYELFSPIIELIGIITIIISYCLNLINLPFMILFLILYALFGALLSFTIFLARIYIEEGQVKIRDMIKAIGICFFEITILRQIMSISRMIAIITYRKKKVSWGEITRMKQHIND